MANYGKWTPEAAAAEEAQAQAEGGSSVSYVKLKVGRNVLRVLPPMIGSASPFHRVYQHYIKDAADKLIVFECPNRGKPADDKRPCPACDEAERLDSTGNPLDKERARGMWASRRVYANVIDRADADKGVQVLVMGKTIYEGLLALGRDPEAGGDFTCPEEGFDVIITRTGTGMDTRYKVTASRSNSPLSEDEDEAEDWLDDMHELPEVVRGLTYEQILAVASGDALEDASSGSDSAPKALPAGRSSRR